MEEKLWVVATSKVRQGVIACGQVLHDTPKARNTRTAHSDGQLSLFIQNTFAEVLNQWCLTIPRFENITLSSARPSG